MSFGKLAVVVIGTVVVMGLVFGLIIGGVFHRLSALRHATDAAWTQVQAVYQRRADLAPDLVNTAQGAANVERATLNDVMRARALVGRVPLPAGSAPDDPYALAQFEQAQGQLGAALSRLLAESERNSELRATTAFRELQAQLADAEDRIAVERGRFNETVQAYNAAMKRVPAVLVAKAFGHAPRPHFTAAAGAQTSPHVEFEFESTVEPKK